MGTLSHNWLTEGLIDFEYKKYMLLAYLQGVKSNFDEKKLYPHLSDLVFHYQNLLTIKDNKKLMQEHFPTKLTDADFTNLKLGYEKMVQDDELMNELEDIITFSIPKFKEQLAEGKDIYEYLESKMVIAPVGLSALHSDEGYLLLRQYTCTDTLIYEYRMTIFTQADEKYRGIHLNYVESKSRSFMNTYENIKAELVKRNPTLPNPATYVIETKTYAPLNESMLPIAKRVLVKYITVS